MDQAQISAALPLTSKVFHILLALAKEPLNGYRLGLEVEGATEGTIRMSPGTLYENLHKLARRGFIREVEEGVADRTDGRGQRYYAITPDGLEVLKAEAQRLARDLKAAESIPAVGI
jgi:DNA-binding PadR family transcriptional regulator